MEDIQRLRSEIEERDHEIERLHQEREKWEKRFVWFSVYVGMLAFIFWLFPFGIKILTGTSIYPRLGFIDDSPAPKVEIKIRPYVDPKDGQDQGKYFPPGQLDQKHENIDDYPGQKL